MNIVLWILQVLVAVGFLAAGAMKLTQPKAKIEERMSWAKPVSATVVKAIGAIEVLGALGLILPSATGILPWLTPLAAVGLAITMIGAIVTHVQLKETSKSVAPFVMLVLCAFIAYGRFVLVPL